MNLVFCCSSDNDLYQLLHSASADTPRFDTLDVALAHATPHAAMLILADTYPVATLTITEQHLQLAREKHLRLYIEYPTQLGSISLGEPQSTHWERVVVSSDFFAPTLTPMTILGQHGCWFLPTEAAHPHMVVARVAGYKTACYGLPNTNVHPILFECPEHNALVATTQLSRFITARYSPSAAWKHIWQRILHWLDPATASLTIDYTPRVRPSFSPDAPLPQNIESNAFKRSADWFRQHMLVSIDHKKYSIEGYESIIDYNGRQFARTVLRADCIGEAAMVMALDWTLRRNPDSKRLASMMLDTVWTEPDLIQLDPSHPGYGLVNWNEKNPVFYGDDNARVILPSMLAARLLADDRWNEPILRCILANFRTTGTLGFRQDSLHYPHSFTDGRDWRHYHNEAYTRHSPHFEAYLWTCNLWLYQLTGHEELFTRTYTAIASTMAVYPKLKWTNGLSQEMARLLLPLAFLIRVKDTPEHRNWLKRVANDLLEQLEPCGAIRELLGQLDDGSYPPPSSNDTYGTNEASLIQKNGDPACDLLYTTNYAFLGLHEAAAVTNDPTLIAAENKLAQFLCRIQLTSESMPHLSGCWMRSFDYDLWEYYGSSADLGWGGWCVESGWTNTWIASVLAMRTQNISLFDLSLTKSMKSLFPKIHTELFQ